MFVFFWPGALCFVSYTTNMMATDEEGLDLSDWDDVLGAEPEQNFTEEKSKQNTLGNESDDEGWGDVIAIEVLENYCSNLMKQMEVLRKGGILCDAVIAVDDRDLPVHRNVLSATSPFFKNVFSQRSTNPDENKITLRNITGQIMEDILHFSYTGEVCIHDGNVRQLLATANFLQLQSLKDMTITYLEQKLSPASSVEILLLAEKHRCDKLLVLAEKIVSDNFAIVSKTEGFKKLTFEILHQFIQSEDLRVLKEEDVYEAVMLWVRSDFGDRREKNNLLPDLLREVRLPLMSPSYVSEISNDPLIQHNRDCYDIIMEGKSYHHPNNINRANFDKKLTRPRKFMGVVWGIIGVGGWQDDKPTKDVFAFITSKNNWFPLNPLPEARYSHSVVSCDGFVYVLGGRDENTRLMSSVIRFDPTANKWQSVASLPYPAASLGVCVFEGQIFVVGGLSNAGSIEIVLRYSARNNVWQRVGNLNFPRGGAAIVADEKFMYALGGMRKVGAGLNAKWQYLNTMEIYRRDTNSWMFGKDMLSKRAHGAAAYLNQHIYLTGGQGELFGINKGMDIYDVLTYEWISVPYFGVPRSMSGISVSDDKFYVIGGFTKEGETVDTVETYDANKDRWSKIVSLPIRLGAVQCCTMQLRLAVLQGMTTSLSE